VKVFSKTKVRAMRRRGLPAPIKALRRLGLFDGVHSIIDFGCGHINCAAILLSRVRGPKCGAAYDPNFRPDRRPLRRKYERVLCTYVLCTIADPAERLAVLAQLHELRAPNGEVYITVRTGATQTGYRSDGSWQGEIKLDFPIVDKGRDYVIYAMPEWDSDPYCVQATTHKPRSHNNGNRS
jgi:hypothetical protein